MSQFGLWEQIQSLQETVKESVNRATLTFSSLLV